jgi:hypothetical protein
MDKPSWISTCVDWVWVVPIDNPLRRLMKLYLNKDRLKVIPLSRVGASNLPEIIY